MNEIKTWVESHPYLSGGFVLGAIVLFVVYSSSGETVQASGGVGGTGLSSGDYASLQATQLNDAAQMQTQQNQLSSQTNQLQAELNATALTTAATNTANQLTAQVQLQNIVTSGQVQEQTNSTALQQTQAQIGGQVQIAGIGAQENEQIAGIQSSTLEDQYATAVQSQNIISQAQTSQAQINGNTQTAIANYAASVQLATIGQQINTVNQTAAVDTDYINQQSALTLNQQNNAYNEYGQLINYQTTALQTGVGVVESGVLNKGGQGGVNQASFLSTLFGGSGSVPVTNNNSTFTIPGLVSISNP